MAAYTLGIDLELISIKRSNNLATPNNAITGGNITTETCGYVRNKFNSYFGRQRVYATSSLTMILIIVFIAGNDPSLQRDFEETRADKKRNE